jgi:hypothetical protein
LRLLPTGIDRRLRRFLLLLEFRNTHPQTDVAQGLVKSNNGLLKVLVLEVMDLMGGHDSLPLPLVVHRIYTLHGKVVDFGQVFLDFVFGHSGDSSKYRKGRMPRRGIPCRYHSKRHRGHPHAELVRSSASRRRGHRAMHRGGAPTIGLWFGASAAERMMRAGHKDTVSNRVPHIIHQVSEDDLSHFSAEGEVDAAFVQLHC